MPVSRLYPALLLASLVPGLLIGLPVLAADPPEHACLNKAEQRVAVAAHRAVPLAQIVKTRVGQGHHGELVRARLCQHDQRLVYVLTLLGRSGRVIRSTVDAANGEAINEH